MENLKSIYQAIVPEPIRKEIRKRQSKLRLLKKRENTLRREFDIYKSSGLMFIHIPKTAGVSVYTALYGKDSFGHAALSEFINVVNRDEVDSIPRACIVRNPYIRLYSGYKYLRHGGRGYPGDLRKQEMLRPHDTFEKFVKEYLASGVALEIEHFKPQIHWVADSSGEPCVDYVGRFETLKESFNEMVELFGIKAAPLPELNTSPDRLKKPREEDSILRVFDGDMISVANRFYKDDFLYFDYAKL